MPRCKCHGQSLRSPPAPPPRTHASYVRKHSREVAPGECTTTTAPCSLCRCVGRCGHGHCLADQGESPIQVLPSSCATVTPPSCCPFKLRATLRRAHHWQHRRRQTLISPPRLAAEPHFGWICPQHCLLGRGSTEHSHFFRAASVALIAAETNYCHHRGWERGRPCAHCCTS
jgi:hypothetical protein